MHAVHEGDEWPGVGASRNGGIGARAPEKGGSRGWRRGQRCAVQCCAELFRARHIDGLLAYLSLSQCHFLARPVIDVLNEGC